MRGVLLLTASNDLAAEFQNLLPKNVRLLSEGDPPPADESFVFIDIDTIKVERIREYAGRTFVIAVTDQERTGPVMEAATFGAHEIMRRPLRKDGIEKVLAELEALKKELLEATKDLIIA